MQHKTWDVICVGRVGVDLYGEQIGGRLEDVVSLRKYVGGSPANVAIGAARLGLKTAMLSRVGDEAMGRFIAETFESEGVDTTLLKIDPARLTALVMLGIQDKDTFPLIFYRENCADMALCEADIDPTQTAKANAIVLSGTHLSQPNTLAAMQKVLQIAATHQIPVILDIDYRPVLWGLTGKGLGEVRYVADSQVSSVIQSVLSACTVIVGTEEEFQIAGGQTTLLAGLQAVREHSNALLVLKQGAAGCRLFEHAVPSVEAGITGRVFQVDVLNVLGAGDAFLSGFLAAYLKNKPLALCATWANACGALVVTRHGCAPASPSFVELSSFLAAQDLPLIPDKSPAFYRLHRGSTQPQQVKDLAVFAFDHRVQLEQLISTYGKNRATLTELKQLFADIVLSMDASEMQCGAIVDDQYGETALSTLSPQKQVWLAKPIELPNSYPLAFLETGSLVARLKTWPRHQVVKCLIQYHSTDSAAIQQVQEQALQRLYEACLETDHEFLLEIIPTKGKSVDSHTVPDILYRLYQKGIYPDWWKLIPTLDAQTWNGITRVIEQQDPFCRGVLALGQDLPFDQVVMRLNMAAQQPICKGFAIGRSLFYEATTQWVAGIIDSPTLKARIQARYQQLISTWIDAKETTQTKRALAPYL